MPDDTEKIHKFISELKQDRHHGASELARMAVSVVQDFITSSSALKITDLQSKTQELIAQLKQARPSMAPISNMLEKYSSKLAAIPDLSIELYRQQAVKYAEMLKHASENASAKAAEYASTVIGDAETIITHSYSSTVLSLLEKIKAGSKKIIISESRPLNEGCKLAETIAGWGLEVNLITDAQIGIFASQSDLAIVGADTVFADGAVMNKAGTYLLALACEANQVPFWVCYETDKQRVEDMVDYAIESMAAEELGHMVSARMQISNVYFDITPAKLITGWITEDGVRRRSA